MGKKARVKAGSIVERPAGEVGPRQPCPCGSGRRYKACHGSAAGAPIFSARPFEGLPGECDLVALREFVPAATAPLRLAGSDRAVQLCSLLPGASPALVREDGTIWLGLQVQHAYGDASRDLGAVLSAALEAEPGAVVGLPTEPGPGPRLQDLLVAEPLEVTVHDGFDFWIADLDDPDGSLAEALEQANDVAQPSERLAGAPAGGAAYWTRMGDKEFLRWVLPHPEDALLDALARLHARQEDRLVEAARLIGMFRAHGVLTPVWDLPLGSGAEALAGPVASLADALASALAETAPLSQAERSAREGLTSRQLTLR